MNWTGRETERGTTEILDCVQNGQVVGEGGGEGPGVRSGSGADGGNLQVLVGDEGVAGWVGRGVGRGPQGFEVGGEGGLAEFVQPAEGDLGGPEVLAKEGNRAGWVGGHVEVDGDELGLHAGEGGGKALADRGFISP